MRIKVDPTPTSTPAMPSAHIAKSSAPMSATATASAEQNHVKIFHWLSQRGVSIGSTTSDSVLAVIRKRTYLLFDAVNENNAVMVTWLLKHGANIEARNKAGDTPLLTAVKKYFPSIVKILLEARANPEIIDSNGYTPLKCSIQLPNFEGWVNREDEFTNEEQREDIALLLLEHGAKPEVTNNSFLAGIIFRGFRKVQTLLFSHSKYESYISTQINSPFVCEEGSLTPLQAAVIKNDAELVKKLLEAKGDPDQEFNPSEIRLINNSDIFKHISANGMKWNLIDKTSTLSIAVWNKNTALVQMLLAAKADPNFKTIGIADGEEDIVLNPVHIATANKDQAMVNLLIQWKAHIFYTCRYVRYVKQGSFIRYETLRHAEEGFTFNGYESSSLWLSIVSGDFATIDIFLNLYNQYSSVNRGHNYQDDIDKAFNKAVILGRLDLIEKLLTAKLKPNIDYGSPFCGFTAIHRTRCPQILKRLIDLKADCKDTDDYGQTLLHLTDNPEIIRILIEQGLDVNQEDENGSVPIHYAKNPEAIKLLVDAKANSNDVIKSFKELHFFDNSEIIRFLIQKGFDVNLRNEYGEAPINYAKNPEAIKLLVDAKADPNVVDRDQHTPLMRAAVNGPCSRVKALLKIKINPVKINWENRYGETALYLASVNNQKEIFDLLLAHGAHFGDPHKNFNLAAVQKLMIDYRNKGQFDRIFLDIWAAGDKSREWTNIECYDYSGLSWQKQYLLMQTIKVVNELKLFQLIQEQCKNIDEMKKTDHLKRRITSIRLGFFVLSPNLKDKITFTDRLLHNSFLTLHKLEEEFIKSHGKDFGCIDETQNLIKPALKIIGVNRNVSLLQLPNVLIHRVLSILIGVEDKFIPQLIMVAFTLQQSAIAYRQALVQRSGSDYRRSQAYYEFSKTPRYYLIRLIYFFNNYPKPSLQQQASASGNQSSASEPQGRLRQRIG